MLGIPTHLRQVRRLAIAAAAVGLVGLAQPASARGPERVADVSELVIDAVVNISTSQKVDTARNTPMPNLPPGSPFEEFFEEFFKNRRGQGDNNAPNRPPRRVNSLGSGFVIDPEGIVITNNHVISEADEVSVVFNDGSKLPAEVIGRDQKTDLAVLRVKPTKPLKAVKFGDSDKLRLGEWVVAIGNHGHRRHRLGAQPRHQFRPL
jgi:serine protease Do